MSYALACYAAVVVGLLGYAVHLERARQHLTRALATLDASNRG